MKRENERANTKCKTKLVKINQKLRKEEKEVPELSSNVFFLFYFRLLDAVVANLDSL